MLEKVQARQGAGRSCSRNSLISSICLPTSDWASCWRTSVFWLKTRLTGFSGMSRTFGPWRSWRSIGSICCDGNEQMTDPARQRTRSAVSPTSHAMAYFGVPGSGARSVWCPRKPGTRPARQRTRSAVSPTGHAMAYFGFIRRMRAQRLNKVDTLIPLGVASKLSKPGGQHVHQFVVSRLRHPGL